MAHQTKQNYNKMILSNSTPLTDEQIESILEQFNINYTEANYLDVYYRSTITTSNGRWQSIIELAVNKERREFSHFHNNEDWHIANRKLNQNDYFSDEEREELERQVHSAIWACIQHNEERMRNINDFIESVVAPDEEED